MNRPCLTSAIGLLAVLFPLCNLAQEPPVQTRVGLIAEHSSLDKGLPAWDSVTASYSRWSGQRESRTLEWTRARRFGLQDTELALGAVIPLGADATATLRGSYSPASKVLARSSAAGALEFAIAPGALLTSEFRLRHYPATDVAEAGLRLEHYFGEWSASAALRRVRALSQSMHAHELRVSRYYGTGSSATLIASRGNEADLAGPDQVLISHARSLALIGRHVVRQPWALTWGLHRVRQGSLYTRTGFSLGVVRVF